MAEGRGNCDYLGYVMTEKQMEELSNSLEEDILERYNDPEYYDPSIIDEFVIDNKLKKVSRKE